MQKKRRTDRVFSVRARMIARQFQFMGVNSLLGKEQAIAWAQTCKEQATAKRNKDRVLSKRDLLHRPYFSTLKMAIR